MDELKQIYRDALAARIQALEAALRSLRAGEEDAVESIQRIARTLKGSGGTYGFHEITAAAENVQVSGAESVAMSLESLLDVLHAVADGGDRDQAQILVVEDDPGTARIVGAQLEAQHYMVHLAKTGAEAENILDKEAISLILLDLILPDTDGRNFLVKLRERPALAGVPVLVTSARGAPNVKAECFALGANGFFEKPLEMESLIAAVAATLQRREEILRETRTDPLTQLPNRAASKEAFGRAQSIALRSSESMALAILDIDFFKSVNDTHGYKKGDEVLQRLSEILRDVARKSDLVVRWGGEEFVVLYPKTTAEGAAQALSKALDHFREEAFAADDGSNFQVTFSAGVVQADGQEDADEVVAEADRLLYLAKESGRNMILTDGDTIIRSPKQVLLAEDDLVIANLVKNRLERAGFKVVHFANGAEALMQAPNIPAKLAILDVKMPGMDGFELIENLRKLPAYQDIPIVMLTSMGSEKDIIRGFDLGADDYIMKPFSILELLARLRRLVKD